MYTQTTIFSVQWPLGAPCNALLKARGRPSPQTYTLFNLLSNNDNSKTAWLFFFYLSLSSGETVSSQGGVVVCSSVSTGPGDESQFENRDFYSYSLNRSSFCEQSLPAEGVRVLSALRLLPTNPPLLPSKRKYKINWSIRACRHSPPILVFGGLKDTLERPTVHLHKLEACVGAGEHAKKKKQVGGTNFLTEEFLS